MSIEGNVATNETLQKLRGNIVVIPQIDEFLTKSGYAADAKVTGDKIKELHDELDKYTVPEANSVKYNNETSGLEALNMQDALDEIHNKAYPKTGGMIEGSVQVQGANDKYSSLGRYLEDEVDYGTLIEDVASDGKSVKVLLSALLNSLAYVDNSGEFRNIFHEGVKPFGQYTEDQIYGECIIDTLGIGSLCLLYCDTHISLVTPKGAFVITLADGTFAWVDGAKINFSDGRLTLKENNPAFYSAGVTYYYQVI